MFLAHVAWLCHSSTVSHSLFGCFQSRVCGQVNSHLVGVNSVTHSVWLDLKDTCLDLESMPMGTRWVLNGQCFCVFTIKGSFLDLKKIEHALFVTYLSSILWSTASSLHFPPNNLDFYTSRNIKVYFGSII